MKIFLLIFSAIFLTTQLQNLFNSKTIKEDLDNDQRIGKRDKYLIIGTLIAVCIVLTYYFLCTIYIKTFIFSIICCIYCLWTIFDANNLHNYLKSNIVSRTLDSKLYRIISKPFNIGFSLYMIYFIAIHW